MSVEAEVIMDRGLSGCELLRRLDMAESSHCALASAKRLAGVFGPVIEPSGTVLDTDIADRLQRRAI